ncbi:hypothetical protein AUEXF2481DRAFT_268555 [Aureobasidium subglaciale EXF-2481]|uniref:Uncharacterized protein n=1 Tax=Aureobasidium subglaciale (strain EXF-2481) TaxID=1043005 RepID=A0A074YE51_AURSE|nr:uncharacterized protein AUEXF2481DRAFT_268555 [Aureobasidium subglaciale EXF-2481]KEQ94334.1 hypothetical protein AUEXF2481DRAFT_268555 [Aureobasidium subglaciale EXF-2481]
MDKRMGLAKKNSPGQKRVNLPVIEGPEDNATSCEVGNVDRLRIVDSDFWYGGHESSFNGEGSAKTGRWKVLLGTSRDDPSQPQLPKLEMGLLVIAPFDRPYKTLCFYLRRPVSYIRKSHPINSSMSVRRFADGLRPCRSSAHHQGCHGLWTSCASPNAKLLPVYNILPPGSSTKTLSRSFSNSTEAFY